MAQRLKSWESPRHQGRNSKGKGGSARQRQLKKQRQMLRKKLKGVSSNQSQAQNPEKRTDILFSFYLTLFNRAIRRNGVAPDCVIMPVGAFALADKSLGKSHRLLTLMRKPLQNCWDAPVPRMRRSGGDMSHKV